MNLLTNRWEFINKRALENRINNAIFYQFDFNLNACILS